MPISNTAMEARARRAARGAGMVVRKSRRELSLDNCGGFMLVDPRTNFPVDGSRYDMTAEDVIRWCQED